MANNAESFICECHLRAGLEVKNRRWEHGGRLVTQNGIFQVINDLAWIFVTNFRTKCEKIREISEKNCGFGGNFWIDG